MFGGYLFGQNGTLRGFVADSTTGEVLVYSNIFLEGTKYGAATDIHGFFLIHAVAPGKYNVIFSYIGYATKVIDVQIFPGKTTEINIKLTPLNISLQEVIKIGENTAQPNETNIGLHSITKRDLEIIPKGIESDAFRLLQTIPGVKSTSDISSRFYVRGGGSDQNLYLYNGTPVYNPYHALGIFSLIDPDLINIIQFYKGGIPTEYGGRLSSVLFIKTKDGNKNKFSGSGSASFLTGKAIIEGPIPNGSFIASGRKSYFGKVLKSFLNNKEAPFDFYDFTFKVNYSNPELLTNSKFSAHTLISKDEIIYGDLSKEDFVFQNNLWGIDYYQVWEKPLYSIMSISSSQYKADVIPNNSNANPRSNSVTDYSWNAHFTYLYESKDELSLGNQIKFFKYDYSFRNLLGNKIDFNGKGVNFDFFAKYKFLRWENLGVEVGTRISPSRMTSTPGPVFLPRLNITFMPWEKLNIKGSIGYFKQEIIAYTDDNDVISIFEPYLILPDYLSPMKAVHYTAGIEYKLNKNINIQIEGYYKKFINLFELNYEKINELQADLKTTQGEAYGLEYSLRFASNDIYFNTAYTLSWAFKGIEDKRYFPRYDSRHAVNVILGYNLGANWTVSAVWALNSGLPFTQSAGFYDKLYLQNFWNQWLVLGNYNPYSLLGSKNIARLPIYHRLDLSLSKKFILFFLQMSLEFNFINVYDRNNIFYFDRDTGERVNMLPFLPTATLKIEI